MMLLNLKLEPRLPKKLKKRERAREGKKENLDEVEVEWSEVEDSLIVEIRAMERKRNKVLFFTLSFAYQRK